MFQIYSKIRYTRETNIIFSMLQSLLLACVPLWRQSAYSASLCWVDKDGYDCPSAIRGASCTMRAYNIGIGQLALTPDTHFYGQLLAHLLNIFVKYENAMANSGNIHKGFNSCMLCHCYHGLFLVMFIINIWQDKFYPNVNHSYYRLVLNCSCAV